MPKLDVYGDIQAAVIAFYFPFLILTFILTAKFGFSRDAGWIFLFTFSMVRITGGALLIAAEKIVPPNQALYTAASILESAGLAPLLLATIGFLGLIGHNAFSEDPRMSRFFRFTGLVALVALALSVAGGIVTSNQSTGRKLRQAGSIVFVAVYVLLVIIHVVCWSHERYISTRGRNLLIGVTTALPFLGVRVAYSVILAYVTSTRKLAPFIRTVQSGDWKRFLVMSLIMEYIVVLIYAVVGAVNTSSKRYRVHERRPR